MSDSTGQVLEPHTGNPKEGFRSVCPLLVRPFLDTSPPVCSAPPPHGLLEKPFALGLLIEAETCDPHTATPNVGPSIRLLVQAWETVVVFLGPPYYNFPTTTTTHVGQCVCYTFSIFVLIIIYIFSGDILIPMYDIHYKKNYFNFTFCFCIAKIVSIFINLFL